jgi:penicillin amidase
MSTRVFNIGFAALGLAAGLYLGARSISPVPPLGQFLDPIHGAWAAAVHPELAHEAAATIPFLSAPVDVRYDERAVPHIFATTLEDAMRALGYVVARDRLFQLDLQTRAATGRLSEIVGAQALPIDLQARQLGMPRAAEQKLAALDSASLGRRLIDAYAQGVNAYADGLPPAEWPVEYKLLGARPERWKPINSVHLFNRMGLTLSYIVDERARARAQAVVGRAAAEALFPSNAVIQEPIQPNGQHAPRFDFSPIPPPGAGDSASLVAALLDRIMPDKSDPTDPTHLASNNWAVAPSRSQSGHALLAGDPHLDLTLPSTWYEAHLVVPGVIDTYGVTIPGAPGIVIGFNRDVAWSVTNAGADVLDFYRETVDDPIHPTRYKLDGAWKPMEQRIETFRGKHGEVLRTDTLRFTHRGPLLKEHGEWMSMRWTILEPSNEVVAFAEATQAKTARDFLDALARGYFAPAQNTIVADRHGSIAIRSTGHFPLRPPGGDGMVIRDGSLSASDWRGYWPVDKYPQSFNPAQGFLASANQQPIDPRDQLAYFADDLAFEPWRAMQINRLLRANASVTMDQMRAYQTDPGSYRADLFVPYFVGAANVVRGSAPPAGPLQDAAALLARWDHRYTVDNEGAALFEDAMRRLRDNTWDELAPNGIRRVATPTDGVMLELLSQPANPWWDDRRTPNVTETRDAIVARSLVAAYDSLTATYGPASNGTWRWGRVAHAEVRHLLQLPGFSLRGLTVQGGRGTMNPSVGTSGHGSSWRMVVELGPELQAWGTYPGGQSGNPASIRYADHVPTWQKGALDRLFVPHAPNELPAAQTSATLSLAPRGK